MPGKLSLLMLLAEGLQVRHIKLFDTWLLEILVLIIQFQNKVLALNKWDDFSCK